MYAIFWSIYAFVIVQIALLLGTQRSFFGEAHGNLLITIELVLFAITCLILYVFIIKKNDIAWAISFITLTCIFIFSGWFVLPNNIENRAYDRVFEYEQSVRDYRFLINNSEKPSENLLNSLKYAQFELGARKLELRAFELRKKAAQEHFYSKFTSWQLWFNALVFLFCSVFAIFNIKSNYR